MNIISINKIRLLAYVFCLITLLVSTNSIAFSSIKTGQDWLQEEHEEKQKLIQAFWQERIIKYNQKSVDTFNKFIINSHFPIDITWQAKIEKLFQDAVDKKIDFYYFLKGLNEFPLVMFREMNGVEHLITEDKFEEMKPYISHSDLKTIRQYIQAKNISSSLTLGDASKELITPNFPENLFQYPFAIHSVGKVFTGVLAIIMIKEGVLSEEDLQLPVQLDSSVLQRLPTSVREQLSKVTLYQLMTHKGGLGDYLGKYCHAISQGRIPVITKVEDFIPFIDEEVYSIGEERYSNAGILLVGLAIQHAYNKKFNISTDYNDILKNYIIKPARIFTFSPWKPDNARYNLEDSIAPHIVGSPAGGYWTTSQDLAKFGQWIYQKALADSQFKILIEKYGQEFYHPDRQVIAHGGGIPSSNAFLSVSLKTGATIAVLSDQPPGLASDLNAMIQEHLFSSKIIPR